MPRLLQRALSVSAAAMLALTPLAGAPVFIPSGAVHVAQAQTAIPATAELQIHKFITTTLGDAGDGTEEDVSDFGQAAGGVKFNVYPVLNEGGERIDLTNTAEWADAEAVTLDDMFAAGAPKTANNVNDARVGAATEVTTSADGTATAANLAAGLYLVVEQPNQTVTVDGQTLQLVPSVPFLVSVPMTNPAGDGWLDTVHVYPKNQSFDAEAAVTKTLSDPLTTEEGVNVTGSSLGEDVRYTVTATVPELPAGASLPGLVVSDKLDGSLGRPENVVVTVTSPSGEVTAVDEIGKVDGESEPVDPTDNRYTAMSGLFEVIRHQVGGQWVLAVRAIGGGGGFELVSGTTVSVQFDTEVETAPTAPITNYGYVLPGNELVPEGWDPASEVGAAYLGGARSAPVTMMFGNVTINKTGQNGENTEGIEATFELHRCEEGAQVTTDPIRVGGATNWTTTDAAGNSATINGIHLGNVVDGTYSDIWSDQGTQFCLVETAVEDGWSLLPEPYLVELAATAETQNVPAATADITNYRSNFGLTLPLTGGIGIWLLIIGGALAMMLGIWWNVRSRRQA